MLADISWPSDLSCRQLAVQRGGILANRRLAQIPSKIDPTPQKISRLLAMSTFRSSVPPQSPPQNTKASTNDRPAFLCRFACWGTYPRHPRSRSPIKPKICQQLILGGGFCTVGVWPKNHPKIDNQPAERVMHRDIPQYDTTYTCHGTFFGSVDD